MLNEKRFSSEMCSHFIKTQVNKNIYKEIWLLLLILSRSRFAQFALLLLFVTCFIPNARSTERNYYCVVVQSIENFSNTLALNLFIIKIEVR